MKLSTKPMSMTTAIICGLIIFCITLWLILFEDIIDEPNLLTKICTRFVQGIIYKIKVVFYMIICKFYS